MCKFLVESGADLNQKGGDSNATAVMWAAQRCHYYIVNLLLQNGADPLLTDGQGYNILHLATIDGNALLLTLLLHQNIPVDVADPQGHTSLMWAGYKGWPPCVDILLRWGANVNATDDNGFTPLHWALVKGSKPCLEKIIEYGADRFAKTNDGKTPLMCAEEMNSKIPFRRALADQGYGPDGNLKTLPLNLTGPLRDKSLMSKFFFLYPYSTLFFCLYAVSQYSIYIGLPLALAIAFVMQWVIQQIALRGPPDFHVLHRTPYLAGLFSGSVFWIGVSFLTALLPSTWAKYPFTNLIFAFLFTSTAYFYSLAMIEDPGFIPKLASRNQQRAMIEELFTLWKFDEDNFCIQCMIRKPLRSKHCRRCGKCVAKHDHHCPWINNCVANNNIRHFYLYIISLEVGIVFYVRLVLLYLDALPTPENPTCNILSPGLCSFVIRDTWTVALTLWAILQLVWVTMLIVVQTVQIAKGQTTFENMRSHSRDGGHKHHHHPHGAPTNSHPAAHLPPPSRKPDGCMTRWKKLLGLDAFMATATEASTGKLQQRTNPFSRGVIINCKDFWCDPAPVFGKRGNGEGYLGGEVVDYAHMYDMPVNLRSRDRGGMVYQGIAMEDHEEV